MSMILCIAIPFLEIIQRNTIIEKHFQQVRYKLLRKGMLEQVNFTFLKSTKEIYIVQEAWHLHPRYQLWSTVSLSVL